MHEAIRSRYSVHDPVVQAPYNTQNYNRYSYVLNNPLSLVDPTGYCYGDFEIVAEMFREADEQSSWGLSAATALKDLKRDAARSEFKARSLAAQKNATDSEASGGGGASPEASDLLTTETATAEAESTQVSEVVSTDGVVEQEGVHRTITVQNPNGQLVIDPSQTAADQTALDQLYAKVQADFGGQIDPNVQVLSVNSIQLIDNQGNVTDSYGMLINANKVVIARTIGGVAVGADQMQATVLHEVMHEQHRLNLGQTFFQYSSSLSNRTHLKFHAIDQQYVNYLNGNGALPRIPRRFRK